MTAAARADLFHARHSVARITHPPDVPLVERLEEARPPGTGIELGARSEERQPAKPACVDALFVVIQEQPTEGGFRTVSEQHVPLIRRQRRGDRSALLLSGWTQVEVEHERILPSSECEVEYRNSRVAAWSRPYLSSLLFPRVICSTDENRPVRNRRSIPRKAASGIAATALEPHCRLGGRRIRGSADQDAAYE